MDEFKELYTTKEAARILGMSPVTLEQARLKGNLNLAFVRVGSRSIRYRREDLQAFIKSLEAHTNTSSSDRGINNK